MALRCKLCGKVLPSRSVSEFMKHLTEQHNAEFVDRVEREFFEL
jgi:hypothetical protein